MFGRRPAKTVRTQARRLGIESLESRIVMTASPLGVETVESVQVSAPMAPPAPVAAILSVEEWVQSLSYWQFDQLEVAHVQYLTSSQLAAIPSKGYLAYLSTSARGALSAPQIRSLNIGNVGISLLTPAQIGYLTVSQVQQVGPADFPLLSVAQIPSLSGTQLASISHHSQFSAMSAAARAALNATQVRALDINVVGLSYLTPTQIAALSAAQVQQVKAAEFKLLPPSLVPHLSASQLASMPTSFFAAMSPAARAALTTTQIRSLDISVVGLSHLTAAQVASISPAQVQQVKFWEFGRLPASQVPYLSLEQIASIPTVGSFNAMTSDARAALTVSQIRSLNIDGIGLSALNIVQVGQLSAAQVQQVKAWELNYLPASQIPYLSFSQLSTIPSASYFSSMSPSARAALTTVQLQALNIGVVGLSALTTSQIGRLASSQVAQVSPSELSRLTPSQIPLVTPSQIAAITSTSMLLQWSSESLAALTPSLVRAINVAGGVSISALPASQIAHLSVSQIEAVPYYNFSSLLPSQIPLLTTAQMAAVRGVGSVLHLSAESRAALSREQIMSLPSDVLARFVPSELDLLAPANYVPVVDRRAMGGHGHSHESMKFYNLAPLSAATHVAVASGNWSDPRVWSNGRVPSADARVVVPTGVVVTFDSFMTAAIDTLRIDGTLTFAVDRFTQLKADTVVVYQTGKLHIGTEANPIRSGVTASVLIADGGPIDRVRDPYGLGRGIVSGGEVRMFGMEVTSYAKLAVDPMAGDTTLQLSSVPVNWKVGDKLVISGSDQYAAAFRSEEVTILAISGTTVTVDRLAYNHDAPDGLGLSIYVANKSRNIVFQAEDASVVSERPHLVFFGNPNVEIENISITGFGRTDKSIPINDPIVINGVLQPGTGTNARARYALHFHHTGVDPLVAPAKVSGSIVVDSPGWGFVNHQSNVIFDGNVALDVKGSAFVTEDGNEIGAFVRNLAMNVLGADSGSIIARREIHDFGFSGHGFWMQGPGVELIGNIAAGTRAAAYLYFTASAKAQFDAINLDNPSLAGDKKSVPVGTVPFKTFQDNVAAASWTGLEIWFHQLNMTDAKSVVSRFKSWNTVSSGVALRYIGQVQIDDAVLVGNLNAYRGTAVSSNNFVQDLEINRLYAVGFENGIDVPARRSTVINGAVISAIQGIYIRKGMEPSRSVLVTGAISILTPPQEQLLGRVATKLVMAEPPAFKGGAEKNLPAYLSADRVIWAPTGSAPMQLFYREQSLGYVPFPAATATGQVPAEYLNKTNNHLWQQYGVTYGGGFLPSNAVTIGGIDGYAVPWTP